MKGHKVSKSALSDWNRRGHAVGLLHQRRAQKLLFALPRDYNPGQLVVLDLAPIAAACRCTVEALRYTLRVLHAAGEFVFADGLIAYIGQRVVELVKATVHAVEAVAKSVENGVKNLAKTTAFFKTVILKKGRPASVSASDLPYEGQSAAASLVADRMTDEARRSIMADFLRPRAQGAENGRQR